jgi:arsenate reductase
VTTTLYGIGNCDTVRKARRWLDERDIDYRFHDFRADGLTEAAVRHWLATLGWETLVNRRSSSWKALPSQEREAMDDARALPQIIAMPTLIKRPLLERGDLLETGFSTARYGEIFGA